jgi:hypothetical protein
MSGSRGGYRLPSTGRPDIRPAGHRGPRKGPSFPEEIAAVIEFHCTAVRHTGMRIDRPHGAAEHVADDRERSRRRRQLQVDAAARPKRSETLNQRSPGAEIDERHVMTGTQRRAGEMEQRRQEPRVVPTIGYLLIHVPSPDR